MDKKPFDFDWVTERRKCSPLQVFERLRLLAEKNVATMNAAIGQHERWEFASVGGDFSVCRVTNAGIQGVRFSLQPQDGRIRVEGEGVKVGFMAGLTLNDDAECRLLVDNHELDLWQVLRRALEPLFFGTSR
jgi:hypothetical protein